MNKNGARDRIIKVENVGDRFLGRAKPRIRLKGYWIMDAGLFPDNFVTVENPSSGVLIIRAVERPKT